MSVLMKKLFIVVLSVFLAVNLFADDDMDKVMSAIESGLAGFGDQSAVNKVRKTKKRRAKKQLDRDAQNRNGKHGFTVNDLDAGGVAKTVEATGDGSSYEEALRAAYKDAVNQVVGAYTHTETQTRNDELVSEETSLIADANVVKHVLLSKEENDGVITIRIKATVVKNESVKNLSQKKTNEVSDGEIANLLNKIDVVEQAEDSLEDIFNNYGEQVFTVEKVGNLSLGPVDFDSKGLLNVLMKFEVAVNPAGFKRFTNRLDMLLDKIALAKKSGYESSSRYWKSMQSFYQKNHPTGSKSITIIHFSGSNVKYNIYIVHAKIYERIVEFLHSPAMVFQFYSKQRQEPTLRVIVRNDDRLDSNYTNFEHFSYEYEERKKNEEHSNNDRNNNSITTITATATAVFTVITATATVVFTAITATAVFTAITVTAGITTITAIITIIGIIMTGIPMNDKLSTAALLSGELRA